MQIDWQLLSEKANNFRMLSETGGDVKGKVRKADRTGKFVTVTFCGLIARLSELLSDVAANANVVLMVYADTLVIDVENPRIHGGVIAARCIDLTFLDNGPLRLTRPEKQTAIQFVAAQTIGGDLRLALIPDVAGDGGEAVATGLPIKAVYASLSAKGKPCITVSEEEETIEDVLENPWHLNSLRSSFVAATWLMDNDDAEHQKLAVSMLRWVVESVSCLRTANPKLSSDWIELYTQAAALLISLDMPKNTFHVPVLAGDVYRSQVNGLTKALEKYESNLKALSQSSDIKKAVSDIAASFKDVAANEVAPFQFQLDNIKENINHVDESIATLQRQYLLHKSDAEINLSLLKAEIAKMRAIQTVEAGIQLAANIYTILSYPSAMANASLTGGGQGLSYDQIKARAASGVADLMQKTIKKETTAAALDALKNSYKVYQSSTASSPAKDFVLSRIHFTQLLSSALELWKNTLDNKGDASEIVKLSANAVDPEGDWSRFMSYIKLEMENMKDSIGTGTASSSARAAANKYQLSLENMASYARAIDTKLVTLTTLMSQGAVLLSQIRAAGNTAKRWEELKNSVASDEGRIALLKSMQQIRIDSIKRSIFTAWTAYRNAYFYLKFKQPKTVLSMEMDAAQMAEAMQKAEAWVIQALENNGSDEVRLPSNDVDIDLVFDICKPGQAKNSNEGVAYLFTDQNGKKTLTWNIAHGDNQLKSLLPKNGNVAIWVREAVFKLEGLETSRKKAVIAKVGTSGMYDNGLAEGGTYHFLTKKIIGNYGYYQDKVHMPWKIDTCTYMTPTPFTMWSMIFEPNSIDPSEATQLRMNLKISFLEEA